jgi:hypothetical protein
LKKNSVELESLAYDQADAEIDEKDDEFKKS